MNFLDGISLKSRVALLIAGIIMMTFFIVQTCVVFGVCCVSGVGGVCGVFWCEMGGVAEWF
jgi:hypothetical protein